jgi:hypothetical protein
MFIQDPGSRIWIFFPSRIRIQGSNSTGSATLFESDVNFAQVLSEEEFVQFYYLLMERPDIEEIFCVYAVAESAAAANRMTPERLARFFAEEQKMVIGAEECAAIIRNHEPTEDKSAFTQLGFVQFLMFSELQVWESTNIKAVLRNQNRNFLP